MAATTTTLYRTYALALLLTLLQVTNAYNAGGGDRSYTKAIEKSIKKPLIVKTSSATASAIPFVASPPSQKTKERTDGPPNYWFHPRIHTFGNTGIMGALHAAMAPFATMLIDTAAYKGENVRVTIGRDLRHLVGKAGANVADLCCGVGISTRALQQAFGDANTIVGIDTSPEMIAMAQVLSTDNVISSVMASNHHNHNHPGACQASYSIANAEGTNLPAGAFDLVTIMYGFHEVPFMGRYRIMREARRLLAPGGKLAIVDISPDYQPSATMLAGEPYVLEYKKNIQTQLRSIQGFMGCKYTEMVKGHVGVWILERKKAFTKRATSAAQAKRRKTTGWVTTTGLAP